jgi:hypothetical protein
MSARGGTRRFEPYSVSTRVLLGLLAATLGIGPGSAAGPLSNVALCVVFPGPTPASDHKILSPRSLRSLSLSVARLTRISIFIFSCFFELESSLPQVADLLFCYSIPFHGCDSLCFKLKEVLHRFGNAIRDEYRASASYTQRFSSSAQRQISGARQLVWSCDRCKISFPYRFLASFRALLLPFPFLSFSSSRFAMLTSIISP